MYGARFARQAPQQLLPGVPAGLCLYFIASSLWGLIERWLLSRHKEKLAAADGGAELIPSAEPPKSGPRGDEKPKSGLAQLWGQLQEAADREKGTGGGPLRNTGKDASRKPKKR